MKLTDLLFNAARACGKLASTLYDVEVIASGNPKRIGKRFVKKAVRKKVYKGLNKRLKKW